MSFIRNSQLHAIRSTLFRLTFLLGPLTGFSAWIEIFHHLWVRVMSDRSTSMFHIMGLRILLVAGWLNRALSLFVCWACCAESVMCRYILTLVQLFLLINCHTMLPLSGWSVASWCATTDWTASSLALNLFGLPLPSILACREWLCRLTIANGIAVLIGNSQIWLLNGAVLSRISVLMSCILALSEFLLVVPSLSIDVLWTWCRNHVSMYTWWTHVCIASLSLVLLWMNYLWLFRAHQHIWRVSLVFSCSRCFCLRDRIPRIWFRAVTTRTHNLPGFCILLRSWRVIFAVNLRIASPSTLLSGLRLVLVRSCLIQWPVDLLLDVLNVSLHRLGTVEDWFVDSSSHWVYRDLNLSIWRAFKCSVQDLLLELGLVAYHREIGGLSWFLIGIRTYWLSEVLFLALRCYILFRRSSAVLKRIWFSFSFLWVELFGKIAVDVLALTTFKSI